MLCALRKLALPTPLASLAKRRRSDDDCTDDVDGDVAMQPLSDEAERARLQGLVDVAAGGQAAEAETPLAAVTELRKALSAQMNPPVQTIVDLGGVDALVSRLRDGSTAMKLEAAWALANIAANSDSPDGVQSQAARVVGAGVVEVAFETLMSPAVANCAELCDRCLWILGNIAGDGVTLRDKLLNMDVMGVLGKIYQQMPEYEWHVHFRTQVLQSLTWLMSSLCRGLPAPPIEEVDCTFDYFTQVLEGTGDVNMLGDALWGLCYLIEGGDGGDGELQQRVERMLSAGFEPGQIPIPPAQHPLVVRIVSCALAVSSTGSPQPVPALRLLGHLVSTPSGDLTDIALAGGTVRALRNALADQRLPTKTRRDAAWALSNIAAGSPAQALELFSGATGRSAWDALVVEQLDAPRDIQLEAAWAVVNMAKGGNEVLSKIEGSQALRLVAAALKAQPDLVLQSALLQTIDTILRHRAHLMAEESTLAQVAAESGLIRCLEELQSSDQTAISQKAAFVLSECLACHNGYASSVVDSAAANDLPDYAATKENQPNRLGADSMASLASSKRPRQYNKFGA